MQFGLHRLPLSAEAQIRSWVTPCGICGVKSGIWTGFFFSVSIILPMLHTYLILILILSEGRAGEACNTSDKNNAVSNIGEFISFHSVVCHTTGPKPLPKRALHIVRSRASSFKWEYPLLSLRSSSSFLRLLRRLPVTSIPLFIFPSITRCRRQFLRKMWPIQFAFRLRISCRIFPAPWL